MSDEKHIAAEPSGGPDPHAWGVMDALPAMIWLAGEDRGRNWFSASWLAFTGRAAGENAGDGWSASVHPDDAAKCLAAYAGSFDARAPFRLVYRLRRADGAWRWVDDSGAPRYAPDGRFLGYAGSCTDIHNWLEAETELGHLKVATRQSAGETDARLRHEIAARHASESDLLHSATQLELLIEGIKDYAIYMLDPEGRVNSWNAGAQAIKGYTAGEITGRHFSCFYTEEDREAGLPARALSEAAMLGKFEAEGWRVRKGGARFWASVLIDPIHDRAGTLVGFGKVTRDLSEKRLANEQLERARESMQQLQKMEAIGQLTGGVAHDFNNLLMVIMGNLDTAQRHAGAAEPGRETRLQRALGNAMQGARRAATLTQRMLAFSRRQPLAPRPLDLNRFIAGEVDFLQRTLGEDVDVQAVGGAGVWKVEVDVNQLEAALLNLAVNARDAMPGGGKLTIETSNAYLDEEYCRINPEAVRGQYVLLSITDNGTGMDRDVVARAFEPFFSTKAVGYGTGLGLSQVHGFIKQSGGHVKLYSEPGEGTTVKIYLPRCFAEEESRQPEERRRPANGQPSETILVVEDDQDVRTYLIETLEDLNYRVLHAADSAAALAIVERGEQGIDLMLTDVVLPGLNGRELSRKAQALRPGLKVLYMTGYSRNAIVHQGRLDPDVELVQKPVTQDALAARIRAMLDAAKG